MERLIYSFSAGVLFLVILFLWYSFYKFSCLALIFPALAYCVIFYGLLESRVEAKNSYLKRFLRETSSLYKRLQGKGLSAIFCLTLSVPLTVFLSVFVARSRPTDWYFFGFAICAFPLIFNIPAMRKHLREGAENVLAKNISGLLVFVVVALSYFLANYYLIPIPGDKISPNSIEKTLEAFTADVGSRCGHVDIVLLVVTEIEGLSWYVMTKASSFLAGDWIKLFLWSIFFLKTAAVYLGFVQGLGGASLLVCKGIEKYRNQTTEAGSEEKSHVGS